MSKRQKIESKNQFQMSVWDYINRLKRKELWSLCNQFENFKEEYKDDRGHPINYRDITNDELRDFLKNEYKNRELTPDF